ncbi:MAG: PD-(D/E)XK nuclease family protein, partial [Candidatus Omnitrophica bacterium]|nr:PD-(D/E)XK nuclease family protein [Candidatus Omnitrophota bacterium]
IVDIVEDILKEIEFKESLNVQKKANIEKFLIILNDLQKFPLFQIATSLRHLMKNSNEPKGDIFTENENEVKILTVHSSKGLEFPIVFLIDIEQGKLDKKNSSVMYNKSKEGMDSQQKYIFGLKTESEEELSEEFYKRIKQDEINLLYVALTRAKQGIICIGYNDVDKNTIWIKILEPFFPQYKAIEVSEDEDINLFSFSYVEEEKQIKKFLPQIHSFIPVSWTSISSVNKTISDFTEKYDEEILGMVIHKILAEIGNNKIPIEFESLKKRAKNYFEKFGSIFDEELLDIHINNIISKNIKEIISSVQNSFNELNFLFFMDNQLFQGYIDRLIIKDDIVYIYDFKTHKNLKIRQDDKKQLFIYKKAAESLFPGKSYKTFLIFTFYGIIKLINTGGKNERRNSSGL